MVFLTFIKAYKNLFSKLDILLILDKPLEFHLNFKRIIALSCETIKNTNIKISKRNYSASILNYNYPKSFLVVKNVLIKT